MANSQILAKGRCEQSCEVPTSCYRPGLPAVAAAPAELFKTVRLQPSRTALTAAPSQKSRKPRSSVDPRCVAQVVRIHRSRLATTFAPGVPFDHFRQISSSIDYRQLDRVRFTPHERTWSRHAGRPLGARKRQGSHQNSRRAGPKLAIFGLRSGYGNASTDQRV